MKITFTKGRKGSGWFAYNDKGVCIGFFLTKWGAIYGAKHYLKRRKNDRKSFEKELK